MAAVIVDVAINHGNVALADIALLEQLVQCALYGFTSCHDHNARCLHIQPVDTLKLRPPLACSCEQ
ncbi:hypothetical protein MNBD_GAMMA13-2116 [hydrothermal vent metagenome]|uniref:Uncharacterized protein n=1 Tax=hydrothermal vent metagenome TaxID=652676 RepID=A0A3B0Z1A0_9ZZZZ